ncbi:MAG: ROK family protein [Methanomicrobiaceae archaeon]|nr:ROK family protein [Methanomicrobiaceae archaeon]MDD5418639.1 ROK family protein [Methanomicrobiaceae archaeon]
MSPLIAVDLGGSNIRTALVTDGGAILAHTTASTPTEGASGAVVTARIIEMIEDILATRTLRQEDGAPAAIGISSAGPLDLGRGSVINSPNIAFPEIELSAPIREHFGIPVHLINDARAGALGERWAGAAQGCDNLVYITISTGIGGGAVVNGTLLLGKDGNAGEIGHLIVEERYGLRCGCGYTGHWEAYASGRNIPQFFAAWLEAGGGGPPGFDAGSVEEIFAAARRREPAALAFMDALGRINARGVSNVIVAYNPEIIVLDGPVARYHGDLIISRMEPYIDRFLALPRIVASGLAGRAPLLGAAAYARERESRPWPAGDCRA